jgi:hypothetical protein
MCPDGQRPSGYHIDLRVIPSLASGALAAHTWLPVCPASRIRIHGFSPPSVSAPIETMGKKRARPDHLQTAVTSPESQTIRVIDPAPWHMPPLDLVPLSSSDAAKLVVGRTTFDAELVLARKYHAWTFNSRHSVITCDLAREAADRLEQLSFLIKSVYALMRHVFATVRFQDASDYQRNYQACFLVELYTETFYYLAHRLQKILADSNSCLPFVVDYDVVDEVQIVRNQLLEHPEGASSGATERRWMYNSNVGPIVKAGRRPDQPACHQDRGLFPNAEELRLSVAKVFSHALSEIAKLPVDYPLFVEVRAPTT